MNKHLKKTVVSSLLLLASAAAATDIPLTNEVEYEFVSNAGKSVAAFRGAIAVPEDRSNPESRMIPLAYVRFPATVKSKESPIVYLAGGPGGSGIATAKWRRFPLFMALREFGDVIALDQRGTGASDVLPRCVVDPAKFTAAPVSDTVYISARKRTLKACVEFWQDQNVQLSGYNTRQSAMDLDALRRHLGAEKMTLWGISYGSHLALAAMKELDHRIDRVIIASAEGLDQTVKLPVRTDGYLARLQSAIDERPETAKKFPDIRGLMHRVHAKLETAPLTVAVDDAPYALQRRSMQMLAAAMISDPARALRLLDAYDALDRDDVEPVRNLLSRFYAPGTETELRAMPEAMDIASGIGARRQRLVMRQGASSVLGTYLNMALHYFDVAPELDLGDAFRTGPASDIPTLLFSGTLDGRTYPESQLEAVAGLRNLTVVTVENAGHNLFMSSPAILQTMQRFLRGEAVLESIITVPLPSID